MKNRIQSLSFLATLAIAIGLISWGGTLNAQTTPSTAPDQQTPSAQQPTPDTPPTQQPSTQPSPSQPEPPTATSPAAPSSQSPTSSQTPDTQSPSSQAPSQTPSTPPSQTPDQAAPGATSPSSQAPAAGESGATATKTGDSQVFTGTVEKQGDKYVLKDDAGKTYDIDHQTDVAKFEGKRVRVQGTLDETGKKITVK